MPSARRQWRALALLGALLLVILTQLMAQSVAYARPALTEHAAATTSATGVAVKSIMMTRTMAAIPSMASVNDRGCRKCSAKPVLKTEMMNSNTNRRKLLSASASAVNSESDNGATVAGSVFDNPLRRRGFVRSGNVTVAGVVAHRNRRRPRFTTAAAAAVTSVDQPTSSLPTTVFSMTTTTTTTTTTTLAEANGTTTPATFAVTPPPRPKINRPVRSRAGSGGGAGGGNTAMGKRRPSNLDRNERSANLSHITGSARKIQLYIKNRFLQLLPDGTVNGTQDDLSDYTILQRTTVDIGKIKIQSVATCLFLCMDTCGTIYGSKDFNEDCVFNESMEEHHYNTYASSVHSNSRRMLYLALNRHGQPRKVQVPAARALGKLATYTKALPQTVAPERVEKLLARLFGANHVRHGLKQLCDSARAPKVAGLRTKPRCNLKSAAAGAVAATSPQGGVAGTKKKKGRRKRRCRDDEPESDLCVRSPVAAGASVAAMGVAPAIGHRKKPAASSPAIHSAVPKHKLCTDDCPKKKPMLAGGGGGGGGPKKTPVKMKRPNVGAKKVRPAGVGRTTTVRPPPTTTTTTTATSTTFFLADDDFDTEEMRSGGGSVDGSGPYTSTEMTAGDDDWTAASDSGTDDLQLALPSIGAQSNNFADDEDIDESDGRSGHLVSVPSRQHNAIVIPYQCLMSILSPAITYTAMTYFTLSRLR